MKDEELRINILRVLYAFHKDNPFNFLKTEVLVSEIGTAEKDVLWHLNYLLDGGYIEGKKFKTFESDGYLEKVKITSKGINTIQPRSDFKRQPQNVQVSIIIDSFFLNVIEEIERADITEEEKKRLLGQVNAFLTDSLMTPLVGAALLRLLQSV